MLGKLFGKRKASPDVIVATLVDSYPLCQQARIEKIA